VEKAKEYRAMMIEAISEFDDKLMEKFIEGQAIPTAKSAPACARPPSR